MKVLICGSRRWVDRGIIERRLRQLPSGTVVVHRDCPTGADALADDIAVEMGLEIRRYPADGSLGKGAGAIRNGDMLRKEHRPGDPVNLGIAFTEDLRRTRGTRDMIQRLRAKGIKTEVITD